MIGNYVVFITICVIGELLVNFTWFRHLKEKFLSPEDINNPKITILRINISTFKGIMERLIMAICLAIGLPSILIVFGALKIGTRLRSPDDKIQNDYFLIGNLSSIFISVIYVYAFEKLMVLPSAVLLNH